MSQTTNTPTQETLTIDQAIEQVKLTSTIWAKLSLKEPGTYGQEIKLSFSYGKDPQTGKAKYYEIYYTIHSSRGEIIREAEFLNEQWAWFDISKVVPSRTTPDKFGNVRNVRFPSEHAPIQHVQEDEAPF